MLTQLRSAAGKRDGRRVGSELLTRSTLASASPGVALHWLRRGVDGKPAAVVPIAVVNLFPPVALWGAGSEQWTPIKAAAEPGTVAGQPALQPDESRSDSAFGPGVQTRVSTSSLTVLPATYYVDSRYGSDSNSGTSAPWKTLAKIRSHGLTRVITFSETRSAWHEILRGSLFRLVQRAYCV